MELNRPNFILWVPVIFGTGSLIYFNLKQEPPIWFSGLAILLAASLLMGFSYFFRALLSDENKSNFYHVLVFLRLGLTALLLIATGFAAANLKTYFTFAPIIKEQPGPVYVHAVLEDIEPVSGGYRAILTEVDLWKIPPDETPLKIRVNIRTDIGMAEPGDKIGLRAMLSPPPKPVYPGGYNFARQAYFKQIGAVGFAVSNVKILEKSKGNPVNKVRFWILNKILSSKAGSEESKQVAAALLVGERGQINKNTIENMRSSGLAHLLAISGLHMAIIMATGFFVIRALLALNQHLTLKYNIKKWAAVISIVLGFFYLLISGAPVSAVRSYIMAALFFIGVILDRTGTIMRPVALAAIVILIIEPEAILTPSFQMSFAAVVALIASFEASRYFNSGNIGSYNFIERIFFYFLAVVFSSFVAGTATAPFVIYHFGQFQQYGMISNLIAIPLTTFWVMPVGMITLMLMPFGLGDFGLGVMCYGIDIILSVADKVSGLPYASLAVTPLSDSAIFITSLGGLWLALWKTKIRLAGIFLIIIGLSAFLFQNRPDLIVDGNGKVFAVKDADNQFYFSNLRKGAFTRKTWLSQNGQREAGHLTEFKNSELVKLHCNKEACVYSKNQKTAYFMLNNSLGKNKTAVNNSTNTECRNYNIFIIMNQNMNCMNTSPLHFTINSENLKTQGTHIVWLGGDKISVDTVGKSLGARPWNRF